VTLLRFNLGELDIVKNEAGRTNIFSMGVNLPPPQKIGKAGQMPNVNFEKQTGFKFDSIDVLNVSVGTANFIDLKDQQQNRTQKIDMQNVVVKNVKSMGDLSGLVLSWRCAAGIFSIRWWIRRRSAPSGNNCIAFCIFGGAFFSNFMACIGILSNQPRASW